MTLDCVLEPSADAQFAGVGCAVWVGVGFGVPGIVGVGVGGGTVPEGGTEGKLGSTSEMAGVGVKKDV